METYTVGFGPHLTLDLYHCEESLIADLSYLCRMLDELPPLIGMTKIAPPYAFFHPGSARSFDKGGITAFVPIAESHITIHTFLGYGFASVDIFSCKPFDIEKAVRYITKKLGAQKVEQNLFDRGKEFPRNLAVIRNIVNDERREIAAREPAPW